MATHPHTSYRPDIDGLRAIAVLAVVGFHLFPVWVKGGFVGVDVFFVISGFLISTIILKGLEQDTFSIAEFYGRRIKRIFPALSLVLIASAAIGWFVLLPGEYAQLGRHIAGGSAFLSNIVLWKESGYFDTGAGLKPLLHLWSLGIEEQFYLVWPWMALLAWRRRVSLLALAMVVVLTSFAYNLSQIEREPVATFYLPFTRFWELLAGGVLACVSAEGSHWVWRVRTPVVRALEKIPGFRGPEAAAGTINFLMAVAGLSLIALAIARIDPKSAFPGWRAGLPVMGTLFLIASGPRTWIHRTLLANRVMVLIGLISYPLYLWHWPLLSLASIVESGLPSRDIRLTIVVMSFVLAWLTYRFLERPIRVRPSAHGLIAGLCLVMAVTGSAGLAINLFDGWPSTSREPAEDLVNGARVRGWRMAVPNTVACTFGGLPDSLCRTTSRPNIAIVGDSHAGALFWGFATSGDPFFSQALIMGKGGCQPTLGAESVPRCDEQLTSALRTLGDNPDIKVVILTSYAGGFLDAAGAPERFFRGYVQTIEALRRMRKTIVFTIDTPTVPFDPEICLPDRRPFRLTKRQPATGCDTYPQFARASYDEMVNRLRQEFPDVLFYDPASLFCATNKCKVFADGYLQYSDFNHVSIYGSQAVASDLIRSSGPAIKRRLRQP